SDSSWCWRSSCSSPAASTGTSSRSRISGGQPLRPSGPVETDARLPEHRRKRMPTILVVDDEAHIRDVVQYALEREGLRVVTAGDGAAALARVGEGDVDLIVLDVVMPEMDGLSVCRRLRAERSVPIVFLSSRGEEVDRINGLELGG